MRARPRVALAIVIGVLLLVIGTLTVVERRSTNEVASTSPSDVGAAATEQLAPRLEQLLSYTPATVRTDLEVEQAFLTGTFENAFATLVTRRIAPTATKFKISTEAEVVDTAIMEAAPERVVALVFVNVTTDSTQLPEPRLSGSRLKITLDKVGDDWLISEFDPI